MREATIWIAVVSLAYLAVPRAYAASVEAAWDNCRAAGGQAAREFACGTNSGYQVIMCTVTPGRAHEDVVGVSAEVYLLADDSELPPWWQLVNPGSCRVTALSAGFDLQPMESDSCFNLWSGSGPPTGGIAAYQTVATFPPVPGGLANAARIRVGAAATAGSAADSAQRYLCFTLRLSNTGTIGDGACGGCSVPVCIRVGAVRLYDGSGAVEVLPGDTGESELHWQDVPSQLCDWPEELGMLWGRIRGLFK